MKRLLHSYFNLALEKYPTHSAIEIGDKIYSYNDLSEKAEKVKNLISSCNTSSPFIALHTNRSISSYAGVLGILKSGKAYMPLTIKHPVERSVSMLEISGADVIVVGNECLEYLERLLLAIKEKKLSIILPETRKADCSFYKTFTESHNFLFKDTVEDEASPLLGRGVGGEAAYLLFTSGSTGIPKGVPITHANACSYIDYILSQFSFSSHDRFSQFFDLSFDPSVHDLFVCWAVGGCLCVVPDEQLFSPAQFIKEKKLTVWYSVPSIVPMMSQMRLLKENSFPLLRYSFFSAEALTSSTIEKWEHAAPSSIIVNLYGPTETTVNISLHVCAKNNLSVLKENIPIGKIFYTHTFCIINENMQEVEKGNEGELCVSGQQVFNGYFNNKGQSKQILVRLPDREMQLWYKTGDLVREDNNGNLYFLGRKDEQVKIRGYRIELEEINACIKKLLHNDLVITLCVENDGSGNKNLVTFISETRFLQSRFAGDAKIASRTNPAFWRDGINLSADRIIEHCQKYLPEYMIPKEIIWVDQIPLTINGKTDKVKLLEIAKQ